MAIATNRTATQEKLGSKILLESGTNELEVLVFHLGGFRYGINGAKVREVVNPPFIRPVPVSHPVLDGLCKLRDMVMPMVNLRKYFNIPEDTEVSSNADASQVVVTVFNEQSIAFRVDRVDRIYRISWQAMREMPGLFLSDRNQFTGMTVIEDEIVLMVDLEKIAEEIRGEQQQLQAKIATTTTKSLAGRRIVYAEDSQIIQAMTCDLLRANGVEDLHVFNNGEAAWKWLEAHHASTPADMVVTDIEMPLMDGLHLASRIRNHPKMKQLPIVLLSSLVNAENEKKGRAVGANAQIVKSKIESLPDIMIPLLPPR